VVIYRVEFFGLISRLHNGRSRFTHSQATCFIGSLPGKMFAVLVDVLLVPIQFNMGTCFNLYMDPHFSTQIGSSGLLSTRGLRDNIILLRRMVVRRVDAAFEVEQWDIPENVRDRTDYRLVITCPDLYIGCLQWIGELSMLLLLELEFLG